MSDALKGARGIQSLKRAERQMVLETLCALVTVTQSLSQAAQRPVLNVRTHYSGVLQGLNTLNKHREFGLM